MKEEEDDSFNPSLYRLLNYDLRSLDDARAFEHYHLHGRTEDRPSVDPLADPDVPVDVYLRIAADLKASKGQIFEAALDRALLTCADIRDPDLALVVHDHRPNGATRYAMFLARALVEEGWKVVLLLPRALQCDADSVDGVMGSVCYLYDAHLLHRILQRLAPRVAYFNSCNTAMARNITALPRKTILLHSHEIHEHYCVRGTHVPDFVVSSEIQRQWKKARRDKTPRIAQAWMPRWHLERIISAGALKPPDITNAHGRRNEARVCVAMSGILHRRKNVVLFLAAAAACPDVDFIWIGGADGACPSSDAVNFYHVPHAQNPWSYLAMVDQFVLTSSVDPCPYVVLECIALGTPVMVFDGSIFTDHTGKGLAYVVLPGPPTPEGLALACGRVQKRDAPREPQRAYIERVFGEAAIRPVLDAVAEKLVPSLDLDWRMYRSYYALSKLDEDGARAHWERNRLRLAGFPWLPSQRDEYGPLDACWDDPPHGNAEEPRKHLTRRWLSAFYESLRLRHLPVAAPRQHYRVLRVLESHWNLAEVLAVLDSHTGARLTLIYPFLEYPARSPWTEHHVVAPRPARICHVITLKRAVDRWAHVERHLKPLPLEIRRFEGFDAGERGNGHAACLRSWQGLLSSHVTDRDHVLVMEDDNVVLDPPRLLRILDILDRHPDDWDIFLGCQGNANATVTDVTTIDGERLLRVHNVTRANCVYINRKAVADLVANSRYGYASHLRYWDRLFNLFSCWTATGLCRVLGRYSYIERRDSSGSENDGIEAAERAVNIKGGLLASVPVTRVDGGNETS